MFLTKASELSLRLAQLHMSFQKVLRSSIFAKSSFNGICNNNNTMTLLGNVLLACGCYGNSDLAQGYRVLQGTNRGNISQPLYNTTQNTSTVIKRNICTKVVFTFFDLGQFSLDL